MEHQITFTPGYALMLIACFYYCLSQFVAHVLIFFTDWWADRKEAKRRKTLNETSKDTNP